MTDKQKQLLTWITVAAVITLATFFGVKYPIPLPPDDAVVTLGTSHFSNIEAADITATDDLTVTDDTVLGDSLTVTGTSTFAGTGTFSADLTIANDFYLTVQTAISPTDGAIITPTGTYQPIQSAGTVTPTLAITDSAGSRYSTGTLLVIINTANTTINLADSGNVKTSGATALAQYDSITLWFDGTYWIEIAQANN
jgi:predicted small lipoprotein YifL